MNPNILVTGGSGLLGSYMLRWLREKGYTRLTATYQHDQQNIPVDLRDGITWKSLILPDLTASFEIVEGHDWVIHAGGYISY
ncbi:MAG TPA: NAD-dependent epimerase/dehydratase family protein, partial [Saprospiraceae bacterium]|nr:NAD-dependent epimerase/dehydratase family protein [Saprospiraceae bacterium]